MQMVVVVVVVVRMEVCTTFIRVSNQLLLCSCDTKSNGTGDGGSGGYAWNGEDGQFDFDNARRSIGGAALPRTPLHLNLGGGGGAGALLLTSHLVLFWTPFHAS